MKFKSKIDWWGHLVFWGFVASAIWMTWNLFWGDRTNEGWLFVLIFWIIEFGLMIPIFTRTYYLLDPGALVVVSWIIKIRIPYGNIVSVKESKNPLSSPALSLDRLEITYHTKSPKSSFILISPKDKQAFVRLLKEKCTLRSPILQK